MFCKYCGANLEETNRFCMQCGKPVDEVTAKEPMEGPPAQAGEDAPKKGKKMLVRGICVAMAAVLVISVTAFVTFWSRRGDEISVKSVNLSYDDATYSVEYTEDGKIEKSCAYAEDMKETINFKYDAEGHLEKAYYTKERDGIKNEITVKKEDSEVLGNGNIKDEFVVKGENQKSDSDVQNFSIEYADTGEIVGLEVDDIFFDAAYSEKGQLEKIEANLLGNKIIGEYKYKNGKLLEIKVVGDFDEIGMQQELIVYSVQYDEEDNYQSMSLADTVVNFYPDENSVGLPAVNLGRKKIPVSYELDEERTRLKVVEAEDNISCEVVFYNPVPKGFGYHDIVRLFLEHYTDCFGVGAIMGLRNVEAMVDLGIVGMCSDIVETIESAIND